MATKTPDKPCWRLFLLNSAGKINACIHRSSMKIVFLAAALLAASPMLHAADSAYSVLRVLGKQSGADSLNRVVEVRGRNGSPAPQVWKVVFAEPRTRGGIREVEVQRGAIISERTPTAGNLGAAMNFNQLNLDSEGAFTIANQQAEKAGVPFDHVDYLLKSGSGGGAPVWELQLFNGRQGKVASMQIAADTGAVSHEEGLRGHADHLYPKVEKLAERPAQDDQDYVRQGSEPRANEPRPTEPRTSARDRRFEEEDANKEPIRDVPSFFRRVGQHFEKRGHQFKRFFTGDF